MNKEGFFPSHVIPDGKIHRFKRDEEDKGKSAWMVAHQNNSTNGGEVFYVAAWGDWRDVDNVYKFCSLTTQSSADKKHIDDLIRKADKARVKEQERVNVECSLKAQEVWPTLSETEMTPYLERKMIGLGGARTMKGVVCVPVRDIEGKLWGFQKIFADGKKLFMPGTKKKGNFHVLRGPKPITESETVYVCEGFATGASINLATNETVVVAFDSGNLEPVCRVLRQALPSARFVVCGDDDRFTRRPDGTPWNPGRESADSAAAAILGVAVFPDLEEGSPQGASDFNDLHVAKGIDAVRSQLCDVSKTAQRHYVIGLGHKGLGYFYTSNYNRQIIGLSSHGPDTLMILQPLEYWEQLYATKTGVDWHKASSDLKKSCHLRGIFNAQHVRGLGVWLDEGRVVVHLGNRLWVDGHEIGLHDLKTSHIYSLEETKKSMVGKALTSKQCGLLLQATHNIAWGRRQDSVFFAGWLVTAMLSGVLQWRPHMWLIGGTGAGKSRIYEIIAKVMGGNVTTLAGGTSEAGLRRSVRGSALPLIFDEFELNNNATLVENQKILAFMRQASSDSVAQIIKADGGAGTVSYQPRFCAFVAGIRPSFDNEADRNRFTLIELDRTKQNAEQWGLVVDAMAQIDEGYTTSLFLRCLGLIDVYRANMAIYEKILAKAHYARFAQQFAPILAGYHLLLSDAVADAQEAADLVAGLQLDHEVSEIRQMNDEQDALNHLLHCKVRCGEIGDRAILELIKAAGYAGAESGNISPTDASNYLHRFGLSVKDRQLFVSNKHPELTKLFDRTRFSINWNYSLSRISGAVKSHVHKIMGKSTRGVLLPLEND